MMWLNTIIIWSHIDHEKLSWQLVMVVYQVSYSPFKYVRGFGCHYVDDIVCHSPLLGLHLLAIHVSFNSIEEEVLHVVSGKDFGQRRSKP